MKKEGESRTWPRASRAIMDFGLSTRLPFADSLIQILYLDLVTMEFWEKQFAEHSGSSLLRYLHNTN